MVRLAESIAAQPSLAGALAELVKTTVQDGWVAGWLVGGRVGGSAGNNSNLNLA